MSEMHLGQPGFKYSACEPFLRKDEKKEKQKIKKPRRFRIDL